MQWIKKRTASTPRRSVERPPRLIGPTAEWPSIKPRRRRHIQFVIPFGTEIQGGIDIAANVSPNDPSGLGIDGDPKRIAGAHEPDLGPPDAAIGEHVALWNRIRAIGSRGDPEDFPAQVLRIGCATAGVPRQFVGMHGGQVLGRRIIANANQQIASGIPGQTTPTMGRAIPSLERNGQQDRLRSVHQPAVPHRKP